MIAAQCLATAGLRKAFHIAAVRQIKSGHRRIALLNRPLEFYFARLRQKGYTDALTRRLCDFGVLPRRAEHGDLALCSAAEMRRTMPNHG